jgi:PadR family transcriptional regulator PadR
MAYEPRLSRQGLFVLHMFENRPLDALAGSDILRETGFLSGTIYPILARLERAKWLISEWEPVDPNEIGRPRKRLYRLTPLGERKAREALKGLSMPVGRLAWNSSPHS